MNDYTTDEVTISYWSKDGYWHIARLDDDGVKRWTDERYETRQEAINAI